MGQSLEEAAGQAGEVAGEFEFQQGGLQYFRALCFGPRSQADYLYLAEHYEMVFVSGLERLTPQEKAEARRLTWLIDVLYDFRVKLCATTTQIGRAHV